LPKKPEKTLATPNLWEKRERKRERREKRSLMIVLGLGSCQNSWADLPSSQTDWPGGQVGIW
jgi:hypothetical protein